MRWGSEAAAALVAGAIACSVAPRRALAQGPPDPTHGRIEGDLAVAVGGGTVVAAGAPRLEGDLRVRYLDSAGVFIAYEDAADGASDMRRVVSAGVELRPLFLGRWLRGAETDRARVDLFVDSFGLEIGLAFWQPAGEPGLDWNRALQLGVGVEVPILARATGPWVGIHGGVRWSDGGAAIGVGPYGRNQAGYLAVTIAWHQIVAAHLVDLGDRPLR